MTLRFPRSALLAAALLAVQPVPQAAACGYEGMPADAFDVIHPGSIAVAVAIRGAIEAGLVEEPAATAAVQGQAGYWAAVRRLDRLQALLAGAPGSAALPATSLVFVDSALWSRLTPAPTGSTTGGIGLQVHTSGLTAGDVALVTGEGVLAAVLDGRIAVAVALDRGLILLDGEPAATAALRELLLQALADPKAAAVPAQQKLRLFATE